MGDKAKSVVVTGAASGIGRATAERLARNGWNVLAVDRDADKLAWAQDNANVIAIAADVTSPEDNARIADEARQRYGKLAAVVLNAGITGGGSIDDLPFEAFHNIMSVNLFGAVLGIKALLPLLRANGGGAISVTSSTMGLGGDSENWAYATSKHAVIGLVRSLSRELGCQNIRINALCPGPTWTGMTDTIRDVAPQHYDLMKQSVPLQRWADPDEQASVIEFLISPAASYVTGHAMVADGGAIVGTGLVPPASEGKSAIPKEINH
ncbi:MAG: SDR family oxidoreductase [Novosphingobium sp.]|nr:SDR family oxidoreductase [Novosphingobium sp.]